jgi:hypothetical protein
MLETVNWRRRLLRALLVGGSTLAVTAGGAWVFPRYYGFVGAVLVGVSAALSLRALRVLSRFGGAKPLVAVGLAVLAVGQVALMGLLLRDVWRWVGAIGAYLLASKALRQVRALSPEEG